MTSQDIIDQAIDFANVRLIEPNIVASVHLEDWQDVLFWDTMIQRQKAGLYNYIAHSKSEKGNLTSGCEQCLKYIGLFSKFFFTCIDSDLRYLLQERDIDAAHWIAQTYTYSWENHYCEASHLQSRLAAILPVVASNFNFEDFLLRYSHTVYRPMLVLLWCLRHHDHRMTKADFYSCLPQQIKASDLSQNGSGLIMSLRLNITAMMHRISLEGIDLDAETKRCAILGLHPDNAYLHIRGHHLYNLVISIGNQICRGTRVNFENRILNATLPANASYWEICNTANNLETILK